VSSTWVTAIDQVVVHRWSKGRHSKDQCTHFLGSGGKLADITPLMPEAHIVAVVIDRAHELDLAQP
jgi:hypothetical protein